jgi:Cu-processing system permease protein
VSGGRSPALRIARAQMRDVIRGRWFLAYLGFVILLTDGLSRFGGDPSRAMLSLMDVMLLVVPLVTIVFATMYFYQAREFVELLLSQPVRRRAVFSGLYLGLMVPLAGVWTLGVGIPLLIHGTAGGSERVTLGALILVGVALTLVFGALGLLVAVRTEDRLRGLGVALGVWLLTAVVYDGLVLLLVSTLANYPLERPMLGLMLANPVDLGRVLLLLRFDISALLGYTGAVFQQFFGGVRGAGIGAAALLLWICLPLMLAARSFTRKDF